MKKAETHGYSASYLRAPSGTVKCDREPREVSGVRAEYEAFYGQQEACSVSSKFSMLAPAIVAELKFKPEGNGNDFVDFSVSNISVCFKVKAWVVGYPEGTLRRYAKAAGAGRVVTVPRQKKLMGVSECRVSA